MVTHQRELSREVTDTFRLALIVPGGGSPAMYTPTFATTAQLAAHEINSQGGVLGREVKLSTLKIGPNALVRPKDILSEICRLSPHGVVICHDSHVRELVVRQVAGRYPIYYPPIWEGGRDRKGVLCTGDSPEIKVWPAIEWLADNASATDWMIVGTDYLWPTGTARAVEPLLQSRGWWHGTHLVPYSLLDDLDGDQRVVLQLVDAVEASSATCVLVLLHGSQMAMFNREFVARGLDNRQLRFAPMADEAVLLASGPDTTRGLLTAFGTVDSQLPPGAKGFAERYASLHGEDSPPPTGVTLVGYDGVAVAHAVATRAGALQPSAAQIADVRANGFEFESPTGFVRVFKNSVERPMDLLTVEGIEMTHLARLS